jgi:DNA polymerase-4
VLSREEACARFGGSPPSLIPGIGPKTAARLAALGLKTLAAVAAAPEQLLIERFGANHGPELQRRARFEHDGIVSSERKVVSESRERTYDYDVRDFAQLAESLATMTRNLCDSLAAKGRGGRTIGIKVRLDDWTTVTRARSIAAPTSDYDVVFAVALALLREYAPPRPVRLLGVRVAGLKHGEPEPAVLEHAPQMALPL